MSLSITTNVPALYAENALSNTTSSLDTSLQRLSTGLKINTGADGPAAYVISQQQQAQIAGLQTAISNTSQATDLVQTADGALGTISNLLVQIRGLALDSANSGVQDASALAANQAQINNAIQTINNIAANTQFGTKQILNGDAGINATSNDSASFTGLGATQLTGAGNYAIDTTGASDTGAAQGALAITAGTTASTIASVAVDAGATPTYVQTGTTITNAEVLTITNANGQSAVVNLTAGETGANIESAINAYTSTTGVIATFGGDHGGLELSSTNGENFTVVGTGGGGAIQTGLTGTNNTASTSSAGAITITGGVAGNKYLSYGGANQHLLDTETLTITGSNGTAKVTLAYGSTLAQVVADINKYTANTGVVASNGTDATSGLQLQSATYGANFSVTSDTGADDGTTGIGTTGFNTASSSTAGLYTVTAAAATQGEQNAQKGAIVVNPGSGTTTTFLDNSTDLAQAELLTIDGLSAGYGTAQIQLAAGETNTQVAQDINNYTSQTGVVADTSGPDGSLRLYSLQFGQNFTAISNVAQVAGSTGIGTTLINTSNGNVDTGSNYNLSVTKGQNAVAKVTNTATNASTLITGNGATVTGSTGVFNGLTFTLTPSSANQFVTTGVGGGSTITVANGTLTFQIGANANQTASLAISNASASHLGIVPGNQFASLQQVDVTTTAGAQATIAVVDQAITDISTESGALGAFQTNTLQSTASNLQTTLTNTQSAESTIADTDYSSEIANFTQLQVQEQAGVSVLGLANQIPQNVLTLLQKL